MTKKGSARAVDSASSERKARLHARTRADILEAAGRAFARSGFDATTMHEIAAEAGYTTASLYTYFPSKQAIFEAMLVGFHEELLGTFEEPVPERLSFEQKLELLLHRQLVAVERRGDTVGVFFHRSPQRIAMEMAARFQGDEDPVYRRSVEWFRANGSESRHTADTQAMALAGLTKEVFLRWMKADPRPPLASHVGTIVDLFLHGVSGPPRDDQ